MWRRDKCALARSLCRGVTATCKGREHIVLPPFTLLLVLSATLVPSPVGVVERFMDPRDARVRLVVPPPTRHRSAPSVIERQESSKGATGGPVLVRFPPPKSGLGATSCLGHFLSAARASCSGRAHQPSRFVSTFSRSWIQSEAGSTEASDFASAIRVSTCERRP